MRREPLHLVTRPRCIVAAVPSDASAFRESKAAEWRGAESSCQYHRGTQLVGARSIGEELYYIFDDIYCQLLAENPTQGYDGKWPISKQKAL